MPEREQIKREAPTRREETVEEVRALLANPRRIREMARHNFEVGQKHLSYDLLRRRLRSLLKGIDSGEA